VAGNEAHEPLLLEAYPEATSAQCSGYAGWATLHYEDGDTREVHCPGCDRDAVAAALAAFMPSRFIEQLELPVDVTAWAKRGPDAEGLYLTGPVGTGKTHVAWSALGAWCLLTGIRPHRGGMGTYETRYGPSVVFTRVTDLLDDLRPGADSTQRVRDCQNAKLLVLDDIGAEKASEWTQERLYSVIDHRYANRLPLIATSNLPPPKLSAQVGERTASRLAQMCMVVPMTGPDRRKPAA
jgi:DNA replication protein DnaC